PTGSRNSSRRSPNCPMGRSLASSSSALWRASYSANTAAARESSKYMALSYTILGHPGARDGERLRRAIHVHEQPLAVGREARPGPLGPDARQRQRIGDAVGRDPAQVVMDVLGVLVLADHQVTVRRHYQVVAEVVLLDIGALVKQLQPVGTARLRPQAKDLAEPGCTAAGAGEVEFAFTHPDAFAARKQRRTRRSAALAQVVLRRLGIVEVDPAHRLPRLRREGRAVPVAAVGQAVDRQRLQPPAFGELPLHVGDEAIEQSVLAVLGLVDDPAR